MVDTVRTLAALQGLLADNTSGDISPQDLRDFLVSAYPLWQPFTPTWTASGTAPSLGNGSLQGSFWQLGTGTGSLVIANYRFAPGSTTTFGTGEWFFSLPVTHIDISTSRPSGSAWAFDAGAGNPWKAGSCMAATTTTVRVFSHNSVTPWSNSAPMTWVDGDSGGWQLAYEAA